MPSKKNILNLLVLFSTFFIIFIVDRILLGRYYFLDEDHLTVDGHKVVAEYLFAHLNDKFHSVQ